MWVRGSRGNNGACSALRQILVTPPNTQKQNGFLWCWFPDGWVCVRSRTLWVSPRNSPVSLGVSPAVSSTPTGVFNQWFKALFPRAGTQGCTVCGQVYQLLPLCQLQLCPPCSTIHHLAGSASHCLTMCPLCPSAHLRPSYQSGWMFLLYLLGCRTSIQFAFLAVLLVFCF